MRDEHLYELLHSVNGIEDKINSNTTKDRFQIALEEAVTADIKKLIESEEPSSCKLVPDHVHQEQLIHEYLKEVDLTDLLHQLSLALEILEKNSEGFFSAENHQTILREISKVRDNFSVIDLQSLENTKLTKALSISTEALELIQQLAIAKFSEKKFPDALALFALLATLQSEEPEYWYRLGLSAQRLGLLDLAIRAYQATSDLAPEFVGANIFASQCFIEKSQLSDALRQLEQAKTSIKNNPNIKDEWKEQIVDIEQLLPNLH